MDVSNIPVFEVGSFFINHYYQVLRETPETSYRFYNASSTVTRVDGEQTQTCSTMRDIHNLLTTLNVSKVEVTRLDVQNSWNGGILLIVCGLMRSWNFLEKRKFTQVFFLAPQDNGFFVMNDVFQFQAEDVVNQHPVPEPVIPVDTNVHATNSHIEKTVPKYELEEETREHMSSLQIEDDSPIDKYSLPPNEQHYEQQYGQQYEQQYGQQYEQQYGQQYEQQYEELEPEVVVEEAPVEEPTYVETAVNHVEDPVPEPAPEPTGDRAKLSYASILQASKGQSSQSLVSRQPAVRHIPSSAVVEQRAQANAQQLNSSASSFAPESADDGSTQEVELTSVYVRSLPLNVTNADLEKAFKSFGKIKPNGVFVRNKKELGVCFAFVEFENMSGVHNAIQASPIELLGKQVYIEERRASTSGSSRGGAVGRGRGRGRGSYQNETSRGNNNYNSIRGNGYQQRTYQV